MLNLRRQTMPRRACTRTSPSTSSGREHASAGMRVALLSGAATNARRSAADLEEANDARPSDPGRTGDDARGPDEYVARLAIGHGRTLARPQCAARRLVPRETTARRGAHDRRRRAGART